MTRARAARPFTRADLDAMPDDGRRHELVDGVLIVSPAPIPQHQFVLAGLYRVLYAACPPGLVVAFAPLDIALAPDTVMEPDLLVAARSAFSAKDLPTAPLLAVEILSPSTRRFDLTLKRDRFEAAGCPSYWTVDPDGPRLTAWRLADGRYVEEADAQGDEVFATDSPFRVEVVPNQLLD